MKIKRQLLLTHGALVFLSLLIIFINIASHKGMESDAMVINKAGRLRALSYNMIYLFNEIDHKENNVDKKLNTDLELRIDEFDNILGKLHDNKKGSGVKIKHDKTIVRLEKISNVWYTEFKPSYKEAIKSELASERRKEMNKEIDPYVESINQMVTEYSHYSREKVLKAININAGLVLLIIGVTIYSFRFTNRRIRLPMQVLMEELKELSFIDSEFSEKLKTIKKDEISEMSEYFNAMMYDQLTKTFNRRAGLSKLGKILHCDDGTCLNLSLCFVDVNGLKEVNDKLGHDSGDELIVSVVEGIKQEIRQDDFIIRMGGDEFLIVLKDVDLENTERFWKRIKKRYEIVNDKEDREYVISVSHGIVESHSDKKADMNELIRKADEKMYIEKKYIKEELGVKSVRE